jgi:hypothetical protein
MDQYFLPQVLEHVQGRRLEVHRQSGTVDGCQGPAEDKVGQQKERLAEDQ